MFERLFGKQDSPLIERAIADMGDMLSRTERMFSAGVEALFEGKDIQLNLEQEDESVNADERMIRRQVIQHLAVNPSQDLPTSLILVSVVADAERLGDLSKGLIETRGLLQAPLTSAHAKKLQDLAKRLIPQFRDCRKSFADRNVELAEKVVQGHLELKPISQQVVEALAKATDVSINEAVALTVGARILRRVSSHLANIASTVIQPFDLIRSDEGGD